MSRYACAFQPKVISENWAPDILSYKLFLLVWTWKFSDFPFCICEDCFEFGCVRAFAFFFGVFPDCVPLHEISYKIIFQRICSANTCEKINSKRRNMYFLSRLLPISKLQNALDFIRHLNSKLSDAHQCQYNNKGSGDF